MLTPCGVLTIPLSAPSPVVCVRIPIVSNAIMTTKLRFKCRPAYLHNARREQLYLIVIYVAKNSGVRSYRHPIRFSLNVQ